jgi:hypothetical protein
VLALGNELVRGHMAWNTGQIECEVARNTVMDVLAGKSDAVDLDHALPARVATILLLAWVVAR